MNIKKSQAAMEFLMTYGWALLVVIIVIAALAFFGLLNPSRFLPEKCEIAPGLTCVDYQATAVTNGSGNFTILLNNGVGQNIEVEYINFTSSTPTNTTATNVCGWNFSGNGLAIGESVTQNFSAFANSSTTQTQCLSGITPNSRFRSDVIIKYWTTVEGTRIAHVKKGYIVVQVQKV
jgi:hypothetical protein